jgi:energy-coupling factor transport system permease protein
VTDGRERARRHAVARSLHPLAWWLWAGGLAAAAMRLTNPLLLGLIVVVVAYVVMARRSDAPWAASFSAFLKLGAVLIVIRVLLEVAFGRRLPGTTLFTLPALDLPDWAAGVSVGGPVTVELLLGAFTAGLRLAVLLICFGAANSLASPYRLLRCLPAVLYEAGVIVTVALAFAPEAVRSAGRLRQARRLRGRPNKGVAAVRGIALPVLEGALDRSIALAASMDARGYGRSADLAPRVRRAAAVATGVGLLAVAVGLYGVLDGGTPTALRLPLVGAGAMVVAVALVAQGRRTPRTRYRPDPWRLAEWVTAASGVAALVGVVVAASIDPRSVEQALQPIEPPAFPLPAVAGILAALLPSVATPHPVMGVPPDEAGQAVSAGGAAEARRAGGAAPSDGPRAEVPT